jgi:hypothetical protein
MTAYALLLSCALGAAVPTPPADPGPPDSVPAVLAPVVPVVREVRYKMAAAIRPLLIFWLRSSNVGAGRILWRAGEDGRRGYELLIGSDPARAPSRINRWGWEREDLGPAGATLFGVMRKTDEESLDEAKSSISAEGTGGFLFKSIRATIAADHMRAENTVWRVSRDYSYRDIGELLALVETKPQHPPNVREARLPEGTSPGFLFAVTSLVEKAVAAATTPGTPRQLPSGLKATFTFNASLYDVTLRSSEWLDSATYGNRSYERLLRMNFEHFNREKQTRERFALVCPTDGPLAHIPVFIEYQPKWWFKAEGVLDDSEVFP